jgi:peptidoglycan/LPS O-acetylase OafA/YrhL
MTTTIDLVSGSITPAPARRDVPRTVRKFRPDIEGLRAIAVTLVVLSHLSLGFSGGYVGVDVFFVISGFLITRQLMNEFNRQNRISFLGFYARRAKRILPAATVVIVATVLALWEWDSPLRLRHDVIDGVFSAFSGINWRLAAAGTNYFNVGVQQSAFQHYWSLAVEEQFYVIWPALLLLVGLLAGRRWGRQVSLIWALIAIMAVSLGLSAATTVSSPSWAYFGTQTRAWELALGALIGVTVTMWTRMPPALACQMSWAGLIMIAVSALTFDAGTVYPGTAAILPVLGSGFVIAGGCPGWKRSGESVLKRKPFQVVGGMSYSWYLTHWPFFVILPLALDHALTLPDRWLVLGGSFVLAAVMFYAVEHPIRSASVFGVHRGFSLSMGGVLVSCSVVVALLVANQGTSFSSGGTVQALGKDATTTQVEAAVLAGARLKDLPPVTPSLVQAHGDQPKTSNPCLVQDSDPNLAPESLCTFGDPNAVRTIAVMGDSHANSWIPAYEQFGKTNHWKVIEFAKAACPPGVYPNDVDPITNRLYTQCNTWRTAVFNRIKQLRPAYVLVASELRTLDIDTSGMVETVHTLQAAGARVIYQEDTPNPEKVGSVPDCLALHPKDIQTCALNRKVPATRLEGMIQRKVETAAVTEAGAKLIDPSNWYCTGATCPPVIDGIVVYSDNSHTTATYTAWLAPVLNAALKKITG